MKIKEAILKSLEDLRDPQSHIEITDHIREKGYCEFGGATPENTVSALCGDFIRDGDSRVKRIKDKGKYLYYLSKNEQYAETTESTDTTTVNKYEREKSFEERDLHKLLSTYLKSIDIYSKTIFHEQSNRSKDENRTWTHPDMIGIRFQKSESKTCYNFLKVISQTDAFKLFSYELKKSINNDSELKKAYFQAVSNSSWANYGYLVAFDISDTLTKEIERLNQSFGIGVILLNANSYQRKVLFQAKYHELDFNTIDKLCKLNPDFEMFIEHTEKVLTAEERRQASAERDLDEFCDSYFDNDTEIETYCKDKCIPIFEL